MNNKLPDIEIIEQKEDSIILKILIARDLPAFEGHFSELPLIPGVVQLNWIVILARKFFDFDFIVKNIENIKFINPISPGTFCFVLIEKDIQRKRINFSYYKDDKTFSKGCFHWESC